MYLHSSTLNLRAPEPRDLDYLFHVENDTREWMVSACKVPYSRLQLQRYVENNAHDLYIDRQLRLMIERNEDRQVVGIVDLFDYSPTNRRAEVGIVVDRSNRRKGYARQALTLLAHYAEHVLDLNQLCAYVFEDNEQARHLFDSCRFKQLAILPEWVYADKKYRNVCLYQQIFEK